MASLVGDLAQRLDHNAQSSIEHFLPPHGPYGTISEYLAKSRGHWWAVPSSTGTHHLTTRGRISMMKNLAGIDLM